VRKDLLAAGVPKATFAGGFGDNDDLKNASKEGRDVDADAAIQQALEAAKSPTSKRKKFVPLNGNILIRQHEAQSPTTLVTLETTDKEKPAEGTVIEKSPELPIEIGAHVVFGKYSGTEKTINGEIFLILRYEDLQGILVDEES